MLLVSTRVGPSPTHGLGLFAAEFVAAGVAVWQYTPAFDVYVSRTAYLSYHPRAREFVDTYGSPNEHGDILLCVDNARFMNHSASPNVSGAGDVNVALRDIAAGEEIVCDYREFDAVFPGKFGN